MLGNRTETNLDVADQYEIYKKLVPKDNFFRRLNELVDFSFLYEHLEGNYCKDFGRPAKDLVMMFKYLIIKEVYNISDVRVVERSMYDLAIKMFLGLDPYETEHINPSSLTKFRRGKIKSDELLNILIAETIRIAKAQSVLTSKIIYIDATHSNSKDNKLKAVDSLKAKTKVIRKKAYETNTEVKGKFPQKPTSDDLDEHVKYTKEMMEVLAEECPNILQTDPVDKLQEFIDDIEHDTLLDTTNGAAVGYKSEDKSFYGYKSHVAMNDDRLIVANVVTPGNCSDTKELATVIDQVMANGLYIEHVVGDGAYSSYNNLMYAKEHGINLVAPVHGIITNAQNLDKDGFIFNKDSDGYICPAGEHSNKKNMKKGKNAGDGDTHTFFFDINKCQNCTIKDGCYKDGAKSKSKTYTVMNNAHKQQLEKMQIPENMILKKERYKIEAKFGEMKNHMKYQDARYSGISGMNIQSGVAIFITNIKRIMKLMGER